MKTNIQPSDTDPSVDQDMIKTEIDQYLSTAKLPCVIAFLIADQIGVSPGQIGKIADKFGIKLSLCQLGLFGYYPKKKLVQPEPPSNENIRIAIQESVTNGKLECQKAWELASKFNVPKQTIANFCEGMRIKIINCQLGAF